MNLIVDDIRPNPKPGYYNIVKTYEKAIKVLSDNIDDIEYLSLDYDLGTNNPTGFDILEWLVENEIYPEQINLHSDNKEMKYKMKQYIEEQFPKGVTIITQNSI